MPRSIPVALEASLDSQQSAAALLYFITIQHPRLTDPVRAVSSPYADNVGAHVLGGGHFHAIPFRLALVSDDDRLPRGRLEVLNYGLEVGRAVLAMRTRPRLTIEAYAAADFTVATSGEPPAHQPIGTPTRVYRAPYLTIVNVSGSTWISGDIASYGPDLSKEPASPMRATEDILPGLFR